MAIMERDVVLTGKDAQGNPTMDFPVTRLDLIEGRAPVQQSMRQTDYIPLVVDGEVKMVPVSAIQALINAATGSLVPSTRKVNGKALSSDITLSAADVGARPSTWTPTAANVGAVPTSRKVNGKALSSDITLSASDVSARPASWTPSAADVGALPDSTVGIAKGGTGATAAAAAIYNLVNALTALSSSGLATGDYLPLLDASGATGKKVTLTNLKTWLQNQNIGARIATGSYTGTGTYGASNPCSLTFDFSPKLVIVSGSSQFLIFITGDPKKTVFAPADQNSEKGMFTISGNTVKWYNENKYNGPMLQLNTGNVSYATLAIG